MACEKCESIHTGQLIGNVRFPCECDCHNNYFSSTGTCNCNSTSFNPCPIHGYRITCNTTVTTPDGCINLNT